jgi:hypothetical protein
MTADSFQAIIDKHRARMRELRDVLDIDGRIQAVSARDPGYSIVLTRNSDPSAIFRITSFRDNQPIGHREYDHLESHSPINSALQEFAGEGWNIIRRDIPRRERERKIKEAEDAMRSCGEAITKMPDAAGKAIFERSKRIWQRRLDALKR